MGKAVAIVGTGDAKTDDEACVHMVQTGNTTASEKFTNTASLADSSQIENASTSVFINRKAVILKKTRISKSTGCEKEGATVLEGVVSVAAPNGPCFMDESSTTVLIEGSGVVRKGDSTKNDVNLATSVANATGEITDGSDNVFVGD